MTVKERFWFAVHDCIAHPLMTIFPPVGNKIHDWVILGPLEEAERGLDQHGLQY